MSFCGRIQQLSHDDGVGILIVEQKARELLAICDRAYCLKPGQVTFAGSPNELKADLQKLRNAFL